MRKHALWLGLVDAVAWLFIFGLGLFLSSKPYRDALSPGFSFRPFVMALLTYTPTNIAALCLMSALGGGCASLLLSRHIPDCAPHLSRDSFYYRCENPIASMLRGLVVYFAFLAGVYVAANDPFASPTPDQYARAAGATSLLAFVVGYDPTCFLTLLKLASPSKSAEEPTDDTNPSPRTP